MRRTRYNALLPVDRPAWLVVRDEINDLVSDVELAPRADFGQVLAEAMERLEKDGWIAEEPPSPSFAGFFCRRDGVRWLVHIAHANPHQNTEQNAQPRAVGIAPESCVLPFRRTIASSE
jgi:hypothetical protein